MLSGEVMGGNGKRVERKGMDESGGDVILNKSL